MNSKILLGIAVALNVALGALLLSGKKGAARLSADGVQPAQVVTNSVIKKVRERIEVASQPELVQLDWRNVESPEYKTYISNLRTIRCPEETIRDIIIADVNKLYAAQKLVEDQVQKVRSDRTLSEEQRKTTLKEMREETEKALTEALGEKGLKRYKNERGWWIRNLK